MQLPVEVVERDIGEQRGDGATLRSTPGRGSHCSIDHDAGPQVPADQRQHPLVGHLPGDADHQDVVGNAIEELLQIEIHGHPVARRPMDLVLLQGTFTPSVHAHAGRTHCMRRTRFARR